MDQGLFSEAMQIFSRMRLWDKKPCVRTFVELLGSSGRSQNLSLGLQMHGFVHKLGFDFIDSHTQSSLIVMYGRCKQMQTAVILFKEVSEKIPELCNSLVTSLLNNDLPEYAMEMLGLMLYEGIEPDEATISMVISALSASKTSTLTDCQLLHIFSVKFGISSSISVLCSLVNAYSSCNHLDFMIRLFCEIMDPNVICYSTMIAGCARNGRGRECLEVFDYMLQRGIKPDDVTFLCVLAGCDHSGLLEEGMAVFKSMSSYELQPDCRHYACMVNLLGRAGLLREAEEFLNLAPVRGDPIMWSSLLNCCRIHGNNIVGHRAARNLLVSGLNDEAILLQVLKFYTEIGDAEGLESIQDVLTAKSITKDVGHSLIAVKDNYELDALPERRAFTQ